MKMTDAIQSVYRAKVFPGRAARSEFWYWQLFQFGISVALNVLLGLFTALSDGAMFGVSLVVLILGIAVYGCILVSFVPSIAVAVRRLHDTNRSGLWLFISLIPLIGWIILIVWFCQKSDVGANDHGQPAA